MDIKQRTTIVPPGTYTDTIVVPANRWRLTITIQSADIQPFCFFPHIPPFTFATCPLRAGGLAGQINFREDYHDVFDYPIIAHGIYAGTATFVETYVDDICCIHNTRLFPFRTTGNVVPFTTSLPPNDRVQLLSANPNRFAVLPGIALSGTVRYFLGDGGNDAQLYAGVAQVLAQQFIDWSDFGPMVQADLWGYTTGVTERGALVEILRVF